MPINIISMDDESVLAEYIDRRGKAHQIPEILGDFQDEKEAKLAVVDEASRLGIVSGPQAMGIRARILSPHSSENLAEWGRKKKKS
jgi:hypothetical protein